MTNQSSHLIQDLVLAELETKVVFIELEPEHLDQALMISQRIQRTSRQWPGYVQALALCGFQDWLQQREPELDVKPKACTTYQPAYANVIDAVGNLQVGEFKVCLLPVIGFDEKTATLPRPVVELPDFIAHFYVVIDVDEDAEAVAIRGFLRGDQLLAKTQTLVADTWNYQLPIAQLTSNTDELLLNLRCLDRDAITLPLVAHRQVPEPLTFASSSLVQLQQGNLQDVLTWEEGVAFLQHPEMVEWLYQHQIASSNAPDFALYIQEQLALVTQQAANAATWLSGELDSVAQQLGLWLSPPQAAAIRWATYEENRDNTIDYLKRRGHKIPDDLTPVHYRVNWSDQQWHLCILAWHQAQNDESSADLSSWSLLLLLTTRNGDRLPAGTCLRVSNQVGVQRQEYLKFEGAVLFTTVNGSYGERFIITVLSPKAAPLVLLPCTFTMDTTQ
ncbi:MAG: DUF1822 family protein [Cyanobacteria bacterium P01_D01_bin.56]